MAGKNNKQKTCYDKNGSSKAKKGIIGLIAAATASVLLLGAAASVMGYGTNGFKDWSFNNFSHKSEYPALVEEPNIGGVTTTTAGDNFIVSDSVSHGISLMSARVAAEDYEDYGVSELAETAITLTATITPANAEYQGVDWTIDWLNAGSEWAQGKTVTDYVTLTPTSDGARTATVENIQAFGEPIIVTVTSQANTNFTAECRCDYSKKTTGAFIQKASEGGNISFTRFSTLSTKEFLNLTQIGFTKVDVGTHFEAAYTLDDNFTVTTKAKIYPIFKEEILKNGTNYQSLNIPDSIEIDGIWGGTAFFYKQNDIEPYINCSAFQANGAISMLKTLGSPLYVYDFVVEVTGTYSSATYNIPITFSANSLPKIVESVSLDNSSIIF